MPRRAFTIIELILLLLTLAGIFLPAMRSARSAARETVCLNNQKQLAVASMSYAADFKDGLATFSWTPEYIASAMNDPANVLAAGVRPQSDMDASAIQATLIIRKRSNDAEFKHPDGWQPHTLWSALVLIDYLAARLPEPILVCPQDRARQSWLSGANATELPAPPHSAWRYSSSYALVPAVYTPNRFSTDGGSLRQGADQSTLVHAPGAESRYRLKPRRMSEIMFPMNKAHWFEQTGWHTRGGARFFTDGAAMSNLAFMDGRVVPSLSAATNPGGYVSVDGKVEAATITYSPRAFLGEPGWNEDAGSSTQPGRYQWTLLGLRGVDFGAPEAQPRAER